MNKKEREILSEIINDIDNADDKIWPLEGLLTEVKKLIKNG